MSTMRSKRELADNSIPRVDSAKTRTQQHNPAQLARIRRDAYTKSLKRRALRVKVFACEFCGYAVQAEGCKVLQCPKCAYVMRECSRAEATRLLNNSREREASR